MRERACQIAKAVCASYQNDPHRLIDILRDIRSRLRGLPPEVIDRVARCVSVPRVRVEGVASFYSFLSTPPGAKITIRLCDEIVAQWRGADEVGRALCAELGIGFEQATRDGAFALSRTPFLGMSDQAPAALFNDVVITNLAAEQVGGIVRELREHGDPQRLVRSYGDGNNAHPSVRAMVRNNIRTAGIAVLGDYEPGTGIRRAVAQSPEQVLAAVKESHLRGRGGAGFPTGMKWDFVRQMPDRERYVVCNADEGEPGTFKDRVLLTEYPDLLFDGMTVAAYATGAHRGLVYLRAEYAYLHRFLEHVLAQRRNRGLLGKTVGGKPGFNFDIRIQLGAGSYICGEEGALLNSSEGLRGDPRTRPPFPPQKGLLGKPTVVNNVETLCCAARIMERGAAWFASLGAPDSKGTKLLSICGDCERPGVYEVAFGARLDEVLEQAGARHAYAVQVGGAGGAMLPRSGFGRRISYQDLATGGSVMVFGAERDLLRVVESFTRFFVEESCGYCTPCRVGTVLLLDRLRAIREGRGAESDLDYLQKLGENVRFASRCGLGQVAPNAILSSLESFRDVYERHLSVPAFDFSPRFDVRSELSDAIRIAGRDSVFFPQHREA
jgi:[NiFe] hydrogenase diaphorase moiety large subunit